MNRIKEFYRISRPAPKRELDDTACDRYYRRLRLQAFTAATLGYSLYYVCRTSLNVMKKPILDSGSLDASQLGVIGSALLFAYAVGKFVNGFIADYCNIKRFMATGLVVSASANALMGVLGLAQSVIPTAVVFVAFAVMWGLNGWAQSMGAPLTLVSPQRTRNLLRILLCKPQPRRVLFIPLRRVDRDLRRMAGRLFRIGSGGSHRGNRHPLLAPRHP